MNNYPTNLTDNQWKIIGKFVDVQARKRKYPLRSVFDAIAVTFNHLSPFPALSPFIAKTFLSVQHACSSVQMCQTDFQDTVLVCYRLVFLFE